MLTAEYPDGETWQAIIYNKRMKTVARIYNSFGSKFGIPRQSGLVGNMSRIVFEKEYRSLDAIRGLEGFEYIWLLWQAEEKDGLTVRPPRLGGKRRLGVFATRSPKRPNPIALSSVRLEGILDGPELIVSGADILSGTAIYDIKPYIPYTDCHPGAKAGFTDDIGQRKLTVVNSEIIPEEIRNEAVELLSLDPRPQYHHDPDRIYCMAYSSFDIKFRIDGNNLFVEEVNGG